LVDKLLVLAMLIIGAYNTPYHRWGGH